MSVRKETKKSKQLNAATLRLVRDFSAPVSWLVVCLSNKSKLILS